MLKLIPHFTRALLYKQKNPINPQIRLLLSESFKLDSVWNARLQSPILSKINVIDMFHELDTQFERVGSANAIDVDLFVNAVDDDSCFDEIEDIVHKLRLSSEAGSILPSTQHALIRLYVKCKKIDDLIRILDDRLNYGIFSDDYCSLLMMDSMIKEGNFRDAAKISTLGMLQEDVTNPLIKYMSLYTCHKYLENPIPWNEEKDEVEKDDDEDEIKVRVRYIRNPYFDDHFDLVDSKHLIGKTLTFVGGEIDDCIGRSYKLLGLILHDKLEHAKEYIQSISKSKENQLLVKDGLKAAALILEEKSKDEKTNHSLNNELKELLTSFNDSQLVVTDPLLNMVEAKLKELVTNSEKLEIEKQINVYKEWDQIREKLIIEHINNINKIKQLEEIEHQKQLLKEKEDELYFFDNENKLDLILEEKEKKKEEQRERERLREEAKNPTPGRRIFTIKKKEEPPLESFFDENIPMKLIKTKLQ